MQPDKAPDDRIPVAFHPGLAGAPPPGAALIVPMGAPVPLSHPLIVRLSPKRHGDGCRCCAPRSSLPEALNRLYVGRARGIVPWFDRVLVALPADGDATASLADPLIASRFRLAVTGTTVGLQSGVPSL